MRYELFLGKQVPNRYFLPLYSQTTKVAANDFVKKLQGMALTYLDEYCIIAVTSHVVWMSCSQITIAKYGCIKQAMP